MSRRKSTDEFRHHFESPELLDGLLELAGSELTTRAVAARMAEAKAAGGNAHAVIPEFFEGEPRFPSPDVARQLFENLLGVWDDPAAAVAQVERAARYVRREKPEKPQPPAPFADSGPDAAFVESARHFLRGDAKSRTRLQHSFENRQDVLLTLLDDAGLSDEGYGVLRQLLFELHAFLELGTGQAPRAVPSLAREGTAAFPELLALKAYADEALDRAEKEETPPVPAAERPAVRAWTDQALVSLWKARAARR